MSLTKEQANTLLQVAKESIQHGLETGQALKVEPSNYAEELQAIRASFVTLEIHNQLRGCIGALTAYQPLVNDVAYHAHAAAFSDPRFMELQRDEFPQLDIHISILSPPKSISFESEEHLVQQLRPGIDGLILTEGMYKGTFLPSVWESLKEPADFLRHLKRKAGLSPNYWSDNIKVERYIAESIS